MSFLKYNEEKRLAADVQKIIVSKIHHLRNFPSISSDWTSDEDFLHPIYSSLTKTTTTDTSSIPRIFLQFI
jgi:hypothetical protein